MSSRDVILSSMALDAAIFAGSLVVHQYNISCQSPSALADVATSVTMWWSMVAFIQDWQALRN